MTPNDRRSRLLELPAELYHRVCNFAIGERLVISGSSIDDFTHDQRTLSSLLQVNQETRHKTEAWMYNTPLVVYLGSVRSFTSGPGRKLLKHAKMVVLAHIWGTWGRDDALSKLHDILRERKLTRLEIEVPPDIPPELWFTIEANLARIWSDIVKEHQMVQDIETPSEDLQKFNITIEEYLGHLSRNVELREDFSWTTEERRTAAFWASSKGGIASLVMWIFRETKENCEYDSVGWVSLHTAVAHGHYDIVQALIHCMHDFEDDQPLTDDTDDEFIDLLSVLTVAINNGDERIVELLLPKFPEDDLKSNMDLIEATNDFKIQKLLAEAVDFDPDYIPFADMMFWAAMGDDKDCFVQMWKRYFNNDKIKIRPIGMFNFGLMRKAQETRDEEFSQTIKDYLRLMETRASRDSSSDEDDSSPGWCSPYSIQ